MNRKKQQQQSSLPPFESVHADSTNSKAVQYGQDYIKYLRKHFIYPDNLYDMILPIKELFQSQGLILYLIDPEKNTINYRQISLESKIMVDIEIERDAFLPAAVAYDKKAYLIENPVSIIKVTIAKNSIYCFPILNSNGEVLLVIEIYRTDGGSYSEKDCEYLTEFGKWCGFAIEQEQKGIIETNIQNVRSVLSSTIYKYLASVGLNDNYDQFLTKILKYCGDTVQARNIVHYELTTTEHKVILGRLVIMNINTLKVLSSRIVIQREAGFVDSVIKKKKILNITINQNNVVNVNKLIKVHLNNELRNVLYVPVESNGDVVGVFGLFNSQRSSAFTKADEEFCKLITYYMIVPAKFKEIKAEYYTERGNKAYNLEVLHYGLLRMLKIPDTCNPDIDIPSTFHEFIWFPVLETEFLSLLYVMITELCPDYFKKESLKLFLMSVKNSARFLAYHNFVQTVLNTHFIYVILRSAEKHEFTVEEKAALMLYSISKYINFLGFDNETLSLMKNATCKGELEMCKENKALKFTKFCIEKSKLLNHFAAETSTKIIKLLDTYFTGPVNVYLNVFKAKLFRYLNNPKFNANDPKFSDIKIHLIIWSSEYCRFLKIFEVCGQLTENLYKELYSLGDFQKRNRLKSNLSPEHDPDNYGKLPTIEYKLIEEFVLPMYKLLTQFFPKCGEILNLCSITQHGFLLLEGQNREGKLFVLEDSYKSKDYVEEIKTVMELYLSKEEI